MLLVLLVETMALWVLTLLISRRITNLNTKAKAKAQILLTRLPQQGRGTVSCIGGKLSLMGQTLRAQQKCMPFELFSFSARTWNWTTLCTLQDDMQMVSAHSNSCSWVVGTLTMRSDYGITPSTGKLIVKLGRRWRGMRGTGCPEILPKN